jgi:ribosomal protein L37AE/L43A
MGVEVIAEKRIKCHECHKKKFIFQVINNKYICTDCIMKLGGDAFIDAFREL